MRDKIKQKNILVLGAYGFTARLIIDRLNSDEIAFDAAGRKRSELDLLKKKYDFMHKFHIIDITDKQNLDYLLDSYDIVINCIGPFNYYSRYILELCASKNIIYLDISGEQNHILESFDNYGDKNKNSSVIIHSLAFESALADLVACRYIDKEVQWSEILSFYHFSKARPSPGTRLTMNTSRIYPTYILADGLLEKRQPGSKTLGTMHPDNKELVAAVYTPYPEIIFFSRRYNVQNSSTYILLNSLEAKYAANVTAGTGNIKEILERHERKSKYEPGKSEYQEQKFQLISHARTRDNKTVCVSLEGYSPYCLTAAIVHRYIQYLLTCPAIEPGVYSPAELNGSNIILNDIISENNLQVNDNYPFNPV